jgi:SAM-dependent methyltransferase
MSYMGLMDSLNKVISPKDCLYPAYVQLGLPNEYFLSGLRQLDFIDSLLSKYAGEQLKDCRSILDYACHYGRLIRCLRAALPAGKLYACDIDEQAVSFCRKEFLCTPVLSGWQPEDLHPGTYDLILCVSLATHTSKDFLARLLAVWERRLNQGGVLVFTFLGEKFVDLWLRGELDHYAPVAPALRPEKAREFYQLGHTFCGSNLYSEEKSYGIGFVRAEIVREIIARHPAFQLCDTISGPDNAFGQDLAVVRKLREV